MTVTGKMQKFLMRQKDGATGAGGGEDGVSALQLESERLARLLWGDRPPPIQREIRRAAAVIMGKWASFCPDSRA